MKAKLFLAYFDSLGFESIIDLTEYDKKAMWASLSEKEAPQRLPVGMFIMRAKANPQRFPEIWTFQSNLSESQLMTIARSSPQNLADLIRQEGSKVFVTPKSKAVIE